MLKYKNGFTLFLNESCQSVSYSQQFPVSKDQIINTNMINSLNFRL